MAISSSSTILTTQALGPPESAPRLAGRHRTVSVVRGVVDTVGPGLSAIPLVVSLLDVLHRTEREPARQPSVIRAFGESDGAPRMWRSGQSPSGPWFSERFIGLVPRECLDSALRTRLFR